ncbi:queuosine-tRNA galactosyltransferase isoform X2 [Anabrus simplex]|uniref:queuosine-tRNA galactosyltransferase isoform X2 n=1 Tax=Anabrus simplex TaxID=316456 RepID=UPI0035A3C67B
MERSTNICQPVDVSIIIPVHNGEPFINESFSSIFSQTAKDYLRLEVSVYNDSSTDETSNLLKTWQEKCSLEPNITMVIGQNTSLLPSGVGFAKNRAVQQSLGTYLCFHDIDDVMKPDRILAQHAAAREHPLAIVGSQFKRIPKDSTTRFTRWANTLRPDQLTKQIYTSHGPTVIMPTWFCHRQVFDRVGGFSEAGVGTPEDLVFFYEHLDRGGDVWRVDKDLVVYRYHPSATTFSISRETIWKIRLRRLQEKVLSRWPNFTIWNAGKQGRLLYRCLDPQFRDRATAFCDVDNKKVGRFYEPYEPGSPRTKRIPIVHFSEATPPLVVCVKLAKELVSRS